MSNNSNNGSLWALALGVVVGGSAAYYLTQTKEGKRMAKKAKKKYKKLKKEAKVKLEENADLLATKATEAVNTTKKMIDGTATVVNSKINSLTNQAEEVVEDTKSSFDKGIEQAQHKLATKTENIEKVLNGIM